MRGCEKLQIFKGNPHFSVRWYFVSFFPSVFCVCFPGCINYNSGLACRKIIVACRLNYRDILHGVLCLEFLSMVFSLCRHFSVLCTYHWVSLACILWISASYVMFKRPWRLSNPPTFLLMLLWSQFPIFKDASWNLFQQMKQTGTWLCFYSSSWQSTWPNIIHELICCFPQILPGSVLRF